MPQSEKTQKQVISYLDNASVYSLSIFLLLLPLFFLTVNTDPFILPKQMLLIIVVAISGILLGVKTLIEGKIRLRATPFDLPLVLLAVASLISAVLAVNKTDALISFIPFFFAITLYFVITNSVKHASQLLILLDGLIIGTTLASLSAVLSYFNIYPLPFPATHVTYFNTFGSLLDQAMFLALVLPITGYFVHSLFKNLRPGSQKSHVFGHANADAPQAITPAAIAFSVSFLLILAGLAITVYQLAATQKPLILPLQTGFQTAFAAISQDTGRVFWGFLFGSGPGTFITDFTRFKPAEYNLSQDLWTFTFFRSSTFVLELLATTGILTLIAFLFLIYKCLKERGFFLPLILAIISAFILPFSPTLVILFFVLLGLFAVIHAHNNPNKFTEVEFYFVALKRGLIAVKTEEESVRLNPQETKYSKLLPIFFVLLLIAFIGIPFYYSARLFISDMLYQKSLVAYSQNNGLATYNLQIASVNMLPRDVYFRALSQVNMALALNLAQRTKSGGKPSSQDQQNILTLIQQSITAGRNAAIIAPLTSFNWSNLSSIYRNLIGFGQNADQFAILTNQQATALDPKNPLQYVDLGGIYYQLGLYDDAIRQFQIAIGLKNDYPNAYYNLGHALEMKGSLNEAKAAYQIVQTLVKNDANNSKKISDEITTLDAKIASKNNQASAQASAQVPNPSITPAAETEPLQVNKPTTLPERKPKAGISGPPISGIPSPTPSKSEPTTNPSTSTTPSITP